MLAKSKTLFHNHALSLICGTLHSSKLISVPSVHRRSYVISKNIIEQRRRSKKKTQKMAKLQSNGDGPVTLRHVRVRQKGGDAMPAPSFVELQVVGNGRGGTPRSLYINTDHSKYLFNCGEGTQRVTMEHKMKISKIQHVFITHNSWDNLGGLLGMCLTMEMASVPMVTIHGPPNVDAIAAKSRSFAQLHSLQIEVADCSRTELSDGAMTVSYVPLTPTHSSGQHSPEAKKIRLAEESKEISMVYVCKPAAKRGSLQLEKCVDLGVPRGPQLGKLQSGQEITLDDGRVIKPSDVFSPSKPRNPIIVVECPTAAYLGPLLDSERLKCHQAVDPAGGDTADIVVHFTPSHVMTDDRYRQWMNGFPPSTRHLVLNELGSEICYEGVYTIQCMLNQLHPQIFPLLPHQTSSSGETDVRVGKIEGVVYGDTNLKYSYRGGKDQTERQFNRDQCIRLDTEKYIRDAFAQEGFPEALEKVKEAVQRMEQPEGVKPALPSASDYPEILFLGTGSAMPSKVRNVSAIWLNLSEDESMLLDCGENTYGQLYRHYGNETPAMLARLSVIFVSHLHADHHMGIMGVAEQRKAVLASRGEAFRPLTVIVPGSIRGWLQNMDQHGLHISDLVDIVPTEYLYENRRDEYQSLYDDILEQLSLEKLAVVNVAHKQFPHGLVIHHRAGWSLVYSGDTKPCQSLVDAGQNCDILIHEATMEDGLEADATLKSHSTMSQAIEVGAQMHAAFILLTHFSQRYSKVPLLNSRLSQQVGIAFDNMRVKRSQLPLLPCLLPAMRYLFSESYASMEEKRQRREKKNRLLHGDSTAEVECTDRMSAAKT